MPSEFASLSVEQIRESFLCSGSDVTSRALRELQRDPRRGVRQIYKTLQKRREQQRKEDLRLDAMLNFERVLWKSGVQDVAGVDEAGVGPLAGPVVAAAVIFSPGARLPGVDDSKRLDEGTRSELAARIREMADVGIGEASVEEIDAINIYQASLLAMRRAVESLSRSPQHVLVDAREIPELAVPQNRFNKGDGINFSIAAASIIAKTHRDRLMEELEATYGGYGFARHKGYCTPEHQEAVRRLGPCAAHRSSYRFLQELCGEYSGLFYTLQRELDLAEGPRDLRRFERSLEVSRNHLSENEWKKLRLTLNRRWKGR